VKKLDGTEEAVGKLRIAISLLKEVRATLDAGSVKCETCGARSSVDKEKWGGFTMLGAAVARVEKVARLLEKKTVGEGRNGKV
jgi:hypothetical protein